MRKLTKSIHWLSVSLFIGLGLTSIYPHPAFSKNVNQADEYKYSGNVKELYHEQLKGGSNGIIKSQIIRFQAGKGSKLLLDADADRGEIKVQFLDSSGNVIPGFSLADNVPVISTGRKLAVSWRSASGKNQLGEGLVDLSRLNYHDVQIEFHLKNATISSYYVDPGSQQIPVRVGNGPHLFIDDFFIAKSENLIRSTHHPKRPAKPSISDKSGKQFSWCSLNFDTLEQIFRLWCRTPGQSVRTSLILFESKDGIQWTPGREVFSFDGFGTQVIANGPDGRDTDRRFKLAYFSFKPPLGMYVSFSPDGVHWTPYEGNPVLLYYPQDHHLWSAGVGDIVDAFWDPLRQRFNTFVKMYPKSKQEFGLQSRTMRDGLGIRLTGQSESQDFIHWVQPWRVFVPEKRDEGVTEFYGATVLARGDLLLAFVRVLRDDLPATPGGAVEGVGYTVLATSRDGRNWHRYNDVFLDRNHKPGAFDHAFAWVTGVTERDGLVYMSYAAYDQGHKEGGRYNGIATIQQDRFVSRRAKDSKPGFLTTPLLIYKGNKVDGLCVNADANSGEIRVQVTDAQNRVIPGFSFQDAVPLNLDSMAQGVRWKNKNLGELSSKAFHLEFYIKNADLYSFTFKSTLTSNNCAINDDTIEMWFP